MDTHFSHMMPGQKYENIRRRILNTVLYSLLISLLGPFWVQNLRSEQKPRNLVINLIYNRAVICPIFGYPQGRSGVDREQRCKELIHPVEYNGITSKSQAVSEA